jgi:hypothetical protein
MEIVGYHRYFETFRRRWWYSEDIIKGSNEMSVITMDGWAHTHCINYKHTMHTCDGLPKLQLIGWTLNFDWLNNRSNWHFLLKCIGWWVSEWVMWCGTRWVRNKWAIIVREHFVWRQERWMDGLSNQVSGRGGGGGDTCGRQTKGN